MIKIREFLTFIHVQLDRDRGKSVDFYLSFPDNNRDKITSSELLEMYRSLEGIAPYKNLLMEMADFHAFNERHGGDDGTLLTMINDINVPRFVMDDVSMLKYISHVANPREVSIIGKIRNMYCLKPMRLIGVTRENLEKYVHDPKIWEELMKTYFPFVKPDSSDVF